MPGFDGFSAADFDAFEQRKWSSNAFNLERLEVKLKLAALGRALAGPLFEELEDQEMELTEERPSIFNQRQVRDLTVFFYRNLEARKRLGAILDKARSIADHVQDAAVHHRHLILGVRIDQAGVQAGIFIHKYAWVDWKNAEQRCQGYGELDRLGQILGGLPAQVRVGHGQGLSAEDPVAASLDGEAFLGGLGKADPWTVVGAAFDRSEPVLADDGFVDQAGGLFQQLLPLRAFIAWSRQNDFHDLKEVIKEHQEKVQRKFSSVEVGDQVRILSGLASGRVGVVDAIEKKGVVKVRMGLLVMSVKMEDLARP
jgi:hypothetical protein